MRHLAGRIPAEETHTIRLLIGTRYQFTRAHRPDAALPILCRLGQAVVPILAEQAVERTASVEHSQVVITPLGVTAADPIGYTVGRERIPVPVEKATARRSCVMDQPPTLYRAHPAVTETPLSDAAILDTQSAADSIRRIRR